MNPLVRDYLQLVRWANLLFLGVLVWVMNQWVAVPILNRAAFGPQVAWPLVLALALALMFIAAGGYVINDYFDVKIDRINRPDRVVVTRTVSRETAWRLSLVLSGVGVLIGLVVSVLLRSLPMGVLFVLVPGLLWFYSAAYKRLFMVGNLLIALLAALVPLMVAMLNVAQLQLRFSDLLPFTTLPRDLYAALGAFALFAFLLTWIREIVKDLEDVNGDRELECHSLPVVWGERGTKIFVTLLIVLTLALIAYLWWAVLPFPHTWYSLSTRFICLAVVIPLLGALWLLWAAAIPTDYRTCQQLLKLVMFLGMLYSYCLNQ